MSMMIYDGSFEGLLTAVFEVYERKLVDAKIIRQEISQCFLYGESLTIISDDTKASRVWTALVKKITVGKRNEIYKTFLSERNDREDILLSFIRYIFSSEKKIEEDYGNKAVLAVAQISKQVHREKHRMEAFVRFQKTKDDLYFAMVEPDFNVLPLIAGHFKDRYADQHWIIYDKKRRYGIQYNKESGNVLEVKVEGESLFGNDFPGSMLQAEDERTYQSLWQYYFQSVNIKARNNRKLHLRHVPFRYWKYLTEKNA